MYKSEGKGLLITCHAGTEGVCVQCHATSGRAQVHVVLEARWVTKPGWTGVEQRKSLGPIKVQTLNGPACSELLY